MIITWKNYLKQNFDDEFNNILQDYDPDKIEDYDLFHDIVYAEAYSSLVRKYNDLV